MAKDKDIEKLKCRLCGAELKGVFLSFSRKHWFHSFSDLDRNSFDIKNIAYECGCADCTTLVCQQCLSKLEYREKGLLLFKKKYAVCPTCNGQFDKGGSRFLVEGRFSNGVTTTVSKDEYGTPKMAFSFTRSSTSGAYYKNEVKDFLGPFPQVCSLCMNPTVVWTVRDTYKHYLGYSNPNQRSYISTPIEYPLCRACHNLLSHPAVKNPGHAYSIMWEIDNDWFRINPDTGLSRMYSPVGSVIKDPTTRTSYSPKGMRFVNPDYAELVRKSKSGT